MRRGPPFRKGAPGRNRAHAIPQTQRKLRCVREVAYDRSDVCGHDGICYCTIHSGRPLSVYCTDTIGMSPSLAPCGRRKNPPRAHKRGACGGGLELCSTARVFPHQKRPHCTAVSVFVIVAVEFRDDTMHGFDLRFAQSRNIYGLVLCHTQKIVCGHPEIIRQAYEHVKGRKSHAVFIFTDNCLRQSHRRSQFALGQAVAFPQLL